MLIKKIISFVLILLSIFLPITSYSYDVFFDSYDTNSWINVNIIKLSNSDNKKVNKLMNTYSFTDWSKTTISIKWFKISERKLDFITNYKWIFYTNNSDFKYEIKSSKNSSQSQKVYLLTWNTLSKIDKKEKSIGDIISFNTSFSENVFNVFSYKVYDYKNKEFPYFLRWPPYIISLNMI